MKTKNEVEKPAPVTHPDVKVALDYARKESGARERGLDFTLTFHEFKTLQRQKKCFYTGVTLTKSNGSGQLRSTDRTLDRIDHRKGYTKENTVACCHAANVVKSMIEVDRSHLIDVTLEEKFYLAQVIIDKTLNNLRGV